MSEYHRATPIVAECCPTCGNKRFAGSVAGNRCKKCGEPVTTYGRSRNRSVLYVICPNGHKAKLTTS